MTDKELLEKYIIEIIKNSHNEDDLEIHASKIKLEDRLKDVIFEFFNSPTSQPDGLQPYLDRFGIGEVWSAYWSNTCFLLLQNLNLNDDDINKLCQIIDGNYSLWTPHQAFQALTSHYSKTRNQKVFEYIVNHIRYAESYTKIGLASSIAKIKKDQRVDKLFEELTQSCIKENTDDSLLRLFYIYKYWFASNNELSSEGVNKLFEIAKTNYVVKYETKRIYDDGREEIISERVDERFKKSLRAYALKLYLNIIKEDRDAQKYFEDWIVRETEVEVKQILIST